jgi:hypothetical protein
LNHRVDVGTVTMKSPEVLFLAGEAELGDRVDAGDEDLLN